MAPPSKPGDLIRAKESAPGSNDDIIGGYRVWIRQNLQQALYDYGKGYENLLDSGMNFLKIGVRDPSSESVGLLSEFGGWDPVAQRYFTKNGQPLTVTDIFSSIHLPPANPVPQNAGDLIPGEIRRSQSDLNPANSKPGSVANVLMKYAYSLLLVRINLFAYRMASTNKSWNSSSYPAVFEGVTVPAQGSLVEFPQLYAFAWLPHDQSWGSMAPPFYGYQESTMMEATTRFDSLAGPYNNPTTPEQELGVDIAMENGPMGILRTYHWINELIKINTSPSRKTETTVDFCHSSCHASCHSSSGGGRTPRPDH